jgi:hypothetical protein
MTDPSNAVEESGIKNLTVSVRLSGEQWDRVVRAAALETQRRGARVYPTVLLSEIGMQGIETILNRAA